MTTDTEEPWNFEHEPEAKDLPAVQNSLGRLWFRIEALLERLQTYLKTNMNTEKTTEPQAKFVRSLNMQGGSGQVVLVQTMHPAIAAVLVLATICSVVVAIRADGRSDAVARQMDAQFASLRNDFQFTRNKAERLEIEVQNNDMILVREGLKKPGDAAKGPAGNPERK